MKELSIEEKAKAYDEAIEKLCSLHEDYDTVSTLIDVKEELENIFPELKESEDERIRKEMIEFVKSRGGFKQEYIAWLESQAEHAKFYGSIQVGDKVTRNQDGVLVNLSQLKRVAKPALDIEIPFGAKDSELQEASYHIPEGFYAEIEGNKVVIKKGEQNLVKIPKFKIGDTIKFKGLGHNRYTIKDVCGTSHYINTSNDRMDMSYTDANFELVEQKPVFEMITPEESLGIDSDTYNKIVDECIYGEHKLADKVEHKFKVGDVMRTIQEAKDGCTDGMPFVVSIDSEYYNCNSEKIAIKDQDKYEYPPMNRKHDFCDSCDEQKPAENKGMNLAEEDMTPFQKKVFCIIDTTIEKEQGLKQVCDELLRLAHDEIIQKPAWSEEDNYNFTSALGCVVFCKERAKEKDDYNHCLDWLKSLKDRYTWKPSDEQMATLEYYMHALIATKHKEILFGLYNDLKQL